MKSIKQKIQLLHPSGKKAVSMEKVKYEAIKERIINYLRINDRATHNDILHAIKGDFKENNIEFPGSIDWHMEWVKLDLEARGIIKRIEDSTVVQYSILK